MASMRQVFGEELASLGGAYPELVVLDADVSSSTMTRLFAQHYPDRFYNFGIAEGNMVAAAAGMASCGQIPVVSSFAFLLAGRALDPAHSLIAYSGLNVKLAGGYAGLSDHADGASHQAVCDLAVMRALPNLTVLSPTDEETTRASVRAMLAHRGPVYLRLSRDEAGSLHGGRVELPPGGAQLLREGDQVAILATGPLLGEALRAAGLLESKGIRAAVAEFIRIKPLDEQLVAQLARRCGRLVTLEEHTVMGGLGDAVCAAACRTHPCRVLKLGLNDRFGESARSYRQLLASCGLDAGSVARAVERFVVEEEEA